MKRPLTQEELSRISHDRPWFGRGREVATRDIEAAEAEILTFSVRRISVREALLDFDAAECGQVELDSLPEAFRQMVFGISKMPPNS